MNKTKKNLFTYFGIICGILGIGLVLITCFDIVEAITAKHKIDVAQTLISIVISIIFLLWGKKAYNNIK